MLAFGFATVFTLLPVYYINEAELTPFQLVLVGTVLESTVFIFEVPTGVVADVYSRRLSVIIGTLLLGIGLAIEGAIPAVVAIFIGEVIRGIGHTFTSGAMEAWLASEIGAETVGNVYLRGNQVEQGASLLGIATSVALARWGLHAPILAGALIILAAGIFLILAMRETSFVPAARMERGSWKATLDTAREGIRTIRRSPLLVTFVLIALFVGMSGEGYDRLWEAHLLENIPFPSLFDLRATTWFGIIAGLSSVLSIVVTETVHRRLDQSHERSVALFLVLCTAAQAAAVLGFAWSGQFFLAVACHLVASLCKGIAAPLRNSWLVRSVDPQVRATVISTVGQADAIGQTAFGPVIGWIGSVRGLRIALSVAGIALSPLVPLFIRAARVARHKPATAAFE
ncbi:MFS transporter [Symbiobacterium thermophilum]|uniref:Multidrug efflux protein n=1 Tax=Symbiobacterium thermophilum (strain DSM 24528 / JCM 14929 / IAM 14863 / T) TaxID=292459 RepID=Q67NN4_SYMTH|nr:MFS transporter [Symbiobacterium thermophilum]BAD40709.1 multidrug efflux protein [Symbiobacterium thermophilum IAM 14863]